MKKLIFLLLISTGSAFAAELSFDRIQELAGQVKWRGPKSKQGLNNKILFHTVRNNFPGFCCCRGGFSVKVSVADYLKQHVLQLGGVALAQSPYCDEICAAVIRKYNLRFEQADERRFPFGPVSLCMIPAIGCTLGSTTLFEEGMSELEKGRIAMSGYAFGSGIGLLVALSSIISYVNAESIKSMRLRGNLAGIPDAEESNESKKNR